MRGGELVGWTAISIKIPLNSVTSASMGKRRHINLSYMLPCRVRIFRQTPAEEVVGKPAEVKGKPLLYNSIVYNDYLIMGRQKRECSISLVNRWKS